MNRNQWLPSALCGTSRISYSFCGAAESEYNSEKLTILPFYHLTYHLTWVFVYGLHASWKINSVRYLFHTFFNAVWKISNHRCQINTFGLKCSLPLDFVTLYWKKVWHSDIFWIALPCWKFESDWTMWQYVIDIRLIECPEASMGSIKQNFVRCIFLII